MALLVSASGSLQPLDLWWHEAPGCPSAATVERRVRELVGHDPNEQLVGQISVEAWPLRIDAQHWRLEFSLRSASGETRRQIDRSSCQELAEATAVAAAFALESKPRTTVAAEPDPEPTQSPRVDATPPRGDCDCQDPEPGPASTPPPRPLVAGPRRGPRLSLSLSPLMDYGGLPALSMGIQGTVGVVAGRVSAAARAAGLAPRILSYDPAGFGARFESWTVGAEGCWSLRRSDFEFPACAAVDLGILTVTGFGVESPSLSRGVWGYAGGGTGVRWFPHPRVGAVARVEALAALVRRRFTIDSVDVYETGPITFRAALGFEVRFF